MNQAVGSISCIRRACAWCPLRCHTQSTASGLLREMGSKSPRHFHFATKTLWGKGGWQRCAFRSVETGVQQLLADEVVLLRGRHRIFQLSSPTDMTAAVAPLVRQVGAAVSPVGWACSGDLLAPRRQQRRQKNRVLVQLPRSVRKQPFSQSLAFCFARPPLGCSPTL